MSGIGILGGTFDPVHIGHLRAALEVSDVLSLDEMQFVPNAIPVHRALPIANAEQRLTMLRLALAGMPNWRINDCELRRATPSYTVDTLRYFRQQFGSSVPLWLLVGTDAFSAFKRWHCWQEILQLSNIAVMVRAGAESIDCASTNALMAQHETVALPSLKVAGMVRRIAVTPLAISATAIRAEVARGKLPHYLVTPAVLDYIQQQNLYQGI